MSISELCEHLDLNRDTFFKWIDTKDFIERRKHKRFQVKDLALAKLWSE